MEFDRVVDGSKMPLLKKLQARLCGQCRLVTNLYLGYCQVHQIYFVDFLHSNDVIRCPICDRPFSEMA